ncbi:MAG: TspO/MBR family protein [Candidatus Micrarchaeia archaeon]
MGQGRKLSLLVGAIIVCQMAGIIGSFFTIPAIPTWYATLKKPFFTPPNWVFTPVWISLFTLMGISLYIILIKGIENQEVRLAVLVFGIQLTLNAIWSFLFFGLKSLFLSFLGISALWLAIIITIALFYKLSKSAALLLIPYLLWVSFAALLNFAVFLLNP